MKRYLGVVGLAVLGVAAVMILGALRSRAPAEPVYKGKKLSEWVHGLSGKAAEQVPAEEAIRQIGANAVPYLLKWSWYDPPTWKTRLYEAVNSAIGSLNSGWAVADEQAVRQGNATLAFVALGPQASPAIPELTRRLNDRRQTDAAMAAARILGFLGKDGLPPLLVLASNQEQEPMLRRFVVWEIGVIGTTNGLCTGVLTDLLTDPNATVREAATNAFGDLGRWGFPKQIRDEKMAYKVK